MVTKKILVLLIFAIFSTNGCVLLRRNLGSYCFKKSGGSLIDENIFENLSKNLIGSIFEYLNFPDFMSAIKYFNIPENTKHALMFDGKQRFYGTKIVEYYGENLAEHYGENLASEYYGENLASEYGFPLRPGKQMAIINITPPIYVYLYESGELKFYPKQGILHDQTDAQHALDIESFDISASGSSQASLYLVKKIIWKLSGCT